MTGPWGGPERALGAALGRAGGGGRSFSELQFSTDVQTRGLCEGRNAEKLKSCEAVSLAV